MASNTKPQSGNGSAPTSLPAGWRTVRFDDAVRDVKESERNPVEAGIDRYVGLEHMEPHSFHLRRWGSLRQDTVSFTKRFRAGQVLFGKRRAYQRKVAVPDFDGICSSDILTFEPKEDVIVADLLPFVVQSDPFFTHALGTSSGSLSPRTRWSQLKDFEFALPPRELQRQLAGLMWAVVDGIRTKSDVLAASQTFYTSSLEHLICKGIGHSAFTNTRLGSTPDSWDVVKMPEVVRRDAKITYGIVQPGEHDPNGVLMILGGDFINGWNDPSQMHRVTPDLHHSYRRSTMSPGDVIICIVGATTGAAAIVPDWGEEANLTQTSARISCDPDRMLPEFMLAYIQSPVGQGFVRRFLTGSAQPRLNLNDFNHFVVPVPPLEEQARIVSLLDSIQESIQATEDAISSDRRLLQIMTSNLLSGSVDV